MGTYVNPGNGAFREILDSEYVDKTSLIGIFDKTVDTANKLVLISRPRRFGKSYAAKMLAAFYDISCDSRALFEDRQVASNNGWDRHLNAYNVVSLEMTGILQSAGHASHVTAEVARLVLPELREIVPDAGMRDVGHGIELKSAMLDVVRSTGHKFVFIIDEWDVPYRLAQEDKAAQDTYAEWLRALFKDNSFTPKAIAGAYLTGILPIKKYNHQSAVSDFREYTMVDPWDYAPYAGFTGEEVEGLCERHGLDLTDVRRWYDGYDLRARDRSYDIYAPFSVMRACERHKTGSYWVSTEAYESLRPYIEMDFDGLQDDLVKAIAGTPIRIDPDGFQNDMTLILEKYDVLTLLVHLGYLAYDSESRTARVPNDEVRGELARAVRRSRHPKLVSIMRDSVNLLDAVVSMREDEVAAGFARVHNRDCTPLFYNNEQALRAVVKSALVAAVDEYARIEELPSGKGYADVVYVPRHGSMMPALVVELKWNKPVDEALKQAHDRGYHETLRGLDVPVLLVGITYDAKTKEHACRMEVFDE